MQGNAASIIEEKVYYWILYDQDWTHVFVRETKQKQQQSHR